MCPVGAQPDVDRLLIAEDAGFKTRLNPKPSAMGNTLSKSGLPRAWRRERLNSNRFSNYTLNFSYGPKTSNIFLDFCFFVGPVRQNQPTFLFLFSNSLGWAGYDEKFKGSEARQFPAPLPAGSLKGILIFQRAFCFPGPVNNSTIGIVAGIFQKVNSAAGF